MKALRIVDGIPEDPVKVMGEYFRRAGSLFAGNLSTNPRELYKQLKKQDNCDEKFNCAAKKFHQLPTELKVFLKEKAEQNAKVKGVIGIENIFNSQYFYDFCHKTYGKKVTSKSICRLIYYVHLRKVFLGGIHESSPIDISKPRLIEYDKPVFPLIVEEMIQHSQSLRRNFRTFEASFLPHGLRQKPNYVNMIKIMPEEFSTLQAAQSISLKVRATVGKIPPRRSPRYLFRSYRDDIRRKRSPSILQFRNVIQAHAFFENYVNYLNTIRYWRLKLLEKAMLG